jgi:hypothetical protein
MGLQTHPGPAPKRPQSSIKKGNARVSAHKASDANIGALPRIVNNRCTVVGTRALISFGKARIVGVLARLNFQLQSGGAQTC